MIRVNLLPLEDRPPDTRPLLNIPKRGFWIPLIVGLAVVVPVAGIGVMQRVKIANLKSDISQAEAEARRLKPQIEKIQALMKERSEINQRLITVQALARERYLPVQVMDEISNQAPDYLWFTKFAETGDGMLSLEGMTFSNLLIAEMMTRMGDGDLFEDVSLGVSERKKVGEQSVLRFTVHARIKR